MNQQSIQISKSVESKPKAKEQVAKIIPRRFFAKYPDGLVDRFGDKGAWNESEPEDTMITILCPTCEHYALVRLDQYQCTQCINAVGEKN